MDDLFNQLYNNLIIEEEIDEDICNICHYKTTNDKLKLVCGHIYHRECVKNLKSCPYCGKSINPNIFIIKNELNVCNSIIKSGKNKGIKCPRINCKLHIKSENDFICKTILKSGKNKGKLCLRINCKIHSKLNI